MRLNQGIPILLLGTLSLLACTKKDNMGGQEPPKLTIEERLQNIIAEKVGTDQLMGVAVSIRVGSEERWNLVDGLSKPGSPIDENMSFGVASITKTVVAAAILKLEEEGKLALTDSISKYLQLNKPQIDENITIFQLLNHFSGVKNKNAALR